MRPRVFSAWGIQIGSFASLQTPFGLEIFWPFSLSYWEANSYYPRRPILEKGHSPKVDEPEGWQCLVNFNRVIWIPLNPFNLWRVVRIPHTATHCSLNIFISNRVGRTTVWPSRTAPVTSYFCGAGLHQEGSCPLPVDRDASAWTFSSVILKTGKLWRWEEFAQPA